MTEREIPISDGKEKGMTEEHVQQEESNEHHEELVNPGQGASASSDHDAVVEMLEKRIKELEGENETLRDQRLRAIADLDNARRRAEQDVMTTVQYANEGLLKKILPIVDDFERSVESTTEEQGMDPFVKGVAMIRNKFAKLLEEEGVTKIKALGEPFDVEFHEAMMRQPSDEPEDIILNELEPGYIYKGKVIRHAKVIVSAGG